MKEGRKIKKGKGRREIGRRDGRRVGKKGGH